MAISIAKGVHKAKLTSFVPLVLGSHFSHVLSTSVRTFLPSPWLSLNLRSWPGSHLGHLCLVRTWGLVFKRTLKRLLTFLQSPRYKGCKYSAVVECLPGMYEFHPWHHEGKGPKGHTGRKKTFVGRSLGYLVHSPSTKGKHRAKGHQDHS